MHHGWPPAFLHDAHERRECAGWRGKAGLDLPFSCRAGVCSTCRTKVVRGEVAMDQNYALEDWELEQGYVLACQSKVRTPLLELDYDER